MTAELRPVSDIKRTHVIDGRLLVVFDGLLGAADIECLGAAVRGLSYSRTESDRSDTKQIRTFATEVPDDLRASAPAFRVFDDLVLQNFPDKRLEHYRSYVNLILYGDQAYAHRDCAPDRDDVTVLCYANETWDPDWGGETLFYNDKGDPVAVVAPQPGRIAVFCGAIEHRVGIPARICHDERLTIACKYKAPGEWR